MLRTGILRGGFLKTIQIFSLISGIALPLLAETIVTNQRIEAFDVQDPVRLAGYFDPGTSLEIVRYLEGTEMYLVSFKGPAGQTIQALCKPENLGINKPLPSRIKAFADDTDQPILFQDLIKLNPSFWSLDSSKFALNQSRFGFKWVSSLDQSLSRSGQLLLFMNFTVYETLVRFGSEKKMEEVNLLLYGRGDSGTGGKDLSESDFMEMLGKVEKNLEEWTGEKGNDAYVKTTDREMKRRSWFKYPLRLDLEWSVTRGAKEKIMGNVVNVQFRPEFIRLTATPYDGKQRIADLIRPSFQTADAPPVRQKELKDRIKKEANGDVFLEGIPMVDQGPKGYCVVASMERMMRYYGLDIDQNEMAKVVNTTQKGSSPEEMLAALKKIGGRFALAVRELKSFTLKDFLEEAKDYNNLAKKGKSHQVIIPTRGIIDLAAIYQEMDKKILKEVYDKNQGERNKFVRDVKLYVDRGAPLLWQVLLGLVKETPELPQTTGGHLRLIIGYSQKSANELEIIYTDSWGAGHEFKRMPIDNAFFITRGLYSAIPGS